MNLFFLSAGCALTKSYSIKNKVLQKQSYPNVARFTSHAVQIKNLRDFEKALHFHANAGECLLKGTLNRPLIDESRAGSTDSNGQTEWICFDVDGLPFNTPDDFLRTIGLHEVSHIVQYSASHGIVDKSLRCHIFMLLGEPASAPLLKQWLITLNFTFFNQYITLTASNNALRWPLDVTACQNDKLLYIAPPVCSNFPDPMTLNQRIKLVQRKLPTLSTFGVINPTETNKQKIKERINELRVAAGLSPTKYVMKVKGNVEYLDKPGEATITEIKEDRGFVYFNLNGGDSWAYYHPVGNHDFIFNFKGEPIYRTQELLPEYWMQQQATTPTLQKGNLQYLAFCDRRSSGYFRGTYDPATNELDITPARNETQVRDFAKQHGFMLGDFVPEWEITFDPHDTVRVDTNNKVINRYAPSEYLLASRPKTKTKHCPPMIAKVIRHALGDPEQPLVDHFLNWLAFIVQFRTMTRTAWVLHGIQGTGKGILLTRVLKPLFGPQQVRYREAGSLDERYNDFVEGSLLVFIDEIQTSALKNERGVVAKLKPMITDPTVSVRKMYQSSFETPNYSNWIFASNKPDVVAIERGDRRFNVAKYQPNKFEPTDHELELIPGEMQAFHDFLMAWPVNKQQAGTPMHTTDREEMMEISEVAIDRAAKAILEGDFEYFVDALPDRQPTNPLHLNDLDEYREVLTALVHRSTGNISRDELRVLLNFTVGEGKLPTSPHKFSRYIRHHRLVIKKVWINDQTTSGLSTTWKEPPLTSYLPKINPSSKTTLKAVK